MPIELAGIKLSRIHKIVTQEQADFVSHRIPGLEGNVVQNLGRNSVHLQIEGIFYGRDVTENLERLRKVHKAREPVDFLAEIVGQAYFAQVILERFEVAQVAREPEQFSYNLTIAEHVVPPEPEPPGFAGVDASILQEAQSFMDVVQLPHLLSLPDFGNPTVPLNSILEDVGSSLESVTDAAEKFKLKDLFRKD